LEKTRSLHVLGKSERCALVFSLFVASFREEHAESSRLALNAVPISSLDRPSAAVVSLITHICCGSSRPLLPASNQRKNRCCFPSYDFPLLLRWSFVPCRCGRRSK